MRHLRALAPAPGPAPEGMVWIAGGEFSMGSKEVGRCACEGSAAMPDARPIHRVYVNGFWMDGTDVTNEQFEQFVKATGYRTIAEIAPTKEDFPGVSTENLVAGSTVFTPTAVPVPLEDPYRWWSYVPGGNWRHPEGPRSDIKGKEKYPVVQIAYPDAAAYAKWADKRLPTEAEWEFAARGGLSGKLYAWGDEFRPGGKWMANTYQGQSGRAGGKKARPQRRLVFMHGSVLHPLHGRHARQGRSEHGQQPRRVPLCPSAGELKKPTLTMQRHPFFTTALVAALGWLLAAPASSHAAGHTKGRAVAPFTPSLKPGDYVWRPEVSPAGPVVVLVSLPEQVLDVYRNGVRIGRSTVSTGKPTPTGVFTVLQKKVDHTSSIYKGAKMPHMQRLTWSGIAMHALAGTPTVTPPEENQLQKRTI